MTYETRQTVLGKRSDYLAKNSRNAKAYPNADSSLINFHLIQDELLILTDVVAELLDYIKEKDSRDAKPK